MFRFEYAHAVPCQQADPLADEHCAQYGLNTCGAQDPGGKTGLTAPDYTQVIDGGVRIHEYKILILQFLQAKTASKSQGVAGIQHGSQLVAGNELCLAVGPVKHSLPADYQVINPLFKPLHQFRLLHLMKGQAYAGMGCLEVPESRRELVLG